MTENILIKIFSSTINFKPQKTITMLFWPMNFKNSWSYTSRKVFMKEDTTCSLPLYILFILFLFFCFNPSLFWAENRTPRSVTAILWTLEVWTRTLEAKGDCVGHRSWNRRLMTWVSLYANVDYLPMVFVLYNTSQLTFF